MTTFYEYVFTGITVCAFAAVFIAVGMGFGFIKGVRYAFTHPKDVLAALDEIEEQEKGES